MVRHGGTWVLDLSGAGLSPSGFFWTSFLIFTGNASLRTGFPPPVEWLSFPPVVAVVLITIKGVESPGSDRVGVIGVLVFFSI